MSAVPAAPRAAIGASPSTAPHLVPAADDAARAAAVAAALARANGKIRSTHLAELTSNGGVDVVPSSRIAAAAARAATRAPPPPAEEAADAEADALRQEMQHDLVGPTLADAGFFQRVCYYGLGWFWTSLFALAKWLAETRLIPGWVRRKHVDGAGRGQAPRAPVAGFSVPSLT